MLTRFLILFCCLQSGISLTQNFNVSGKVTDAANSPLSFVNVLVYKADSEKPLKGTTTDADGSFILNGLEAETYIINFSYIGFEDFIKTIDLSSTKNIGNIVLNENHEMLDETIVTAKLPTIQKTAGKLVFNVENTSFSVGSTMDLLKKTPGVVVIGESIQVKFSSPIIYINGKRVYLSSAEVASLLENTDAANIKSIEVITNPSSKYDADAGTVLNIVTSKPISVGYKGSVNGTFTQAIYPKYNFGTSHFYKNNWLNIYASYNYNTRKEYKEDDGYIRFFLPDEVSTKSIWEMDFNRTTDSENHSGNIGVDFTLDAKNSLSFTSNVSISPDVNYNNHGEAYIFNPQRQLDSTFTTLSDVDFKKENLTFNLEYKRMLDAKGSLLSVSSNYIYYDHIQNQSVDTDYFLANGSFLRNNSFYTNSHQNSTIFTGQTDLFTELFGGNFETGFKYSNIDTESMLDFFDVINNSDFYNNALSDDFNYKESIYAEYINFEKEWEKWSFTLGLRGEYTDIDAISRSLGKVNTQQYFELFPSASVNYNINDNNTIGFGYNRSIHRPRYESLNPFRYFITENDFRGGNPNLVPAIDDKISLSYSYKNKLSFEAYYINVENGLTILTFQNNQNSKFWRIDANILREKQYSFDILYFDSLFKWWWFQISTSTFYLADDFLALESAQEKFRNDTFGQYVSFYSNFTITKDRSFTSDLNYHYLSNFVSGSNSFKNQSFLNISVTKEFWNKRASLTAGVDDIFNSFNVPLTTQYLNQDNSYLAKPETRLFRVGFKYNFGNARLGDNSKQIKTDEGERLEEKTGL